MIYRNFDADKERAEQRGDEWQFGAASQASLYQIPLAEREAYLPQGEVQRGVEDYQDCASRGPVNYLAAEFTYAYQNGLMKPENKKWLEDNGYAKDGGIDFSDAFISILSGTTRNGNSLKAPVDAIHMYGLIPKAMLPAEKWMSFDSYQYPGRITQTMRDLGEEFSRRFTINYEQVPVGDFALALERSGLDVGTYAWPFPVNGVYPRDDRPFNHVIYLYSLPAFMAFDNYVEVGTTDDFTKHLAPDYRFFDWGYRIYVSSEQVPSSQVDPLTVALRWITGIITWLKGGKAGPMPAMPSELTPDAPKPAPVPIPPPAPETAAERLADAAQSMLGKDASPRNLAPQELSCAEGVSNIVHSCFPDFSGNVISTQELYKLLSSSDRFKRVMDPVAGCVVISPTVGTIHGHTGIYITNNKIASNSSATGKWTQNYTRAGWIAYFADTLHLKGYLFVPVDL